MKICQFTQTELDLLRKECNFTDIESKCFEAKAKDCSDVQLALDLNISESSVAVIMRRVRSKITTVLKHKVQTLNMTEMSGCDRGCPNIVYHTMAEWARIPDYLSTKGTLYVYADYRTENGVNIPRIKFGDGINSLSNIPFATMSITDGDMNYWDGRTEFDGNNFGDIVVINEIYNRDNKFIFPTDGYLMLKFNSNAIEEYAEVEIYSASEQSYFKLSKHADTDRQSKEVFVRRGMRCAYVEASKNAEIRFVPLV
jgi:hypothetical protein